MGENEIFESLQELECTLRYRSWHNPEDQSLKEMYDLVHSALLLWHKKYNS